MIIGIDPGRDKIGWALTDEVGGLILSGIFFASDTDPFLDVLSQYVLFRKVVSDKSFHPWIKERPGEILLGETIDRIVIGDGTASALFRKKLKTVGLEFISIDEKGTTLEARSLYWKLHKPVFWQRLLPEGLRVPPRSLDDLAAWAIVLRYKDM